MNGACMVFRRVAIFPNFSIPVWPTHVLSSPRNCVTADLGTCHSPVLVLIVTSGTYAERAKLIDRSEAETLWANLEEIVGCRCQDEPDSNTKRKRKWKRPVERRLPCACQITFVNRRCSNEGWFWGRRDKGGGGGGINCPPPTAHCSLLKGVSILL